MGIIFAKCLRSRLPAATGNTPTEKEQTIKKLRRTKRQLNLYIKKIEAKIKQQKLQAIEAHNVKDTNEALKHYKLMKLYQKNADNVYGMVNNIAKSLSDMENNEIDAKVYDTLQDGNALINQLQENADVSELQEVKEEIKSTSEYNSRLTNIFSSTKEEEQQFSKELDNIEAEQVKEEFSDPNMKVPTNDISEEEKELEVHIEMPQEDKNDKLMGTA